MAGRTCRLDEGWSGERQANGVSHRTRNKDLFKSSRPALTIVVLGGVGAGGQLGGGRRREDQDVRAGGVLGCVEL